LPAESVRAFATSATLKPVVMPAGVAADPGYRPSAKTADIDHTVAWPNGPTHPSNIKPYCRGHHLLSGFTDASDQDLKGRKNQVDRR
jgi:hypothetical protein